MFCEERKKEWYTVYVQYFGSIDKGHVVANFTLKARQDTVSGQQWNSSKPDTTETDKSVLNREVASFFRGYSKYSNVSFGTEKPVLSLEVSSMSGVSILMQGVPLYIKLHESNIGTYTIGTL